MSAEFHEHLDTCEKCKNHPFALCIDGLDLLSSIANGETIIIWDNPMPRASSIETVKDEREPLPESFRKNDRD